MTAKLNLDLIKERRKDLGLTTTDMAKALGLRGHDQYSRRETGIYQFRATELPVLCKTLDIEMDKIFIKNSVKTALK